ncbi:MarR family winged helix-turn-helix transcriptional regulator [Bacillus nakamurai]|nr:MarR family winged helix-turn-helix transcriptional regulator [Bacillus nakamurai]
MNKEPYKTNNDRDKKYSVLLWHRIVRMYKNNTKETNHLLNKLNLSNAQFDVISRIAESKKLSQQELAEKLLVTKGNITQLLQKLEQMKLIKKEKVWKTNYISLTDEGKELYDEITPLLRDFQLNYFSKLTQEEKKQLLYLLRKAEV